MLIDSIYDALFTFDQETTMPLPHPTIMPTFSHSLMDSRYIPQNIIQEEFTKHCYLYQTIRSTVPDVDISVYSIGKHLNHKTWLLILAAVYVLNKTQNIRNSVSVILAYSPHKKLLPAQQTLSRLDVNNINSGVSTQHDSTCIIYRKEEMHKVILHELMHLWQHDMHQHQGGNLAIGELLHITPPPLLNEGYIDALACIHLVAFRLFFWSNKKHQHDTKETFRNAFNTQLKTDTQHVINTAAKVIAFYNKREWIENTHAFSYYVVKALILMHIKRFLKHYQSKNKNNVHAYIESLCTRKNMNIIVSKSSDSHDFHDSHDSQSLRMFPEMTVA